MPDDPNVRRDRARRSITGLDLAEPGIVAGISSQVRKKCLWLRLLCGGGLCDAIADSTHVISQVVEVEVISFLVRSTG